MSEQWKLRASAYQDKTESDEPLHYAEVYKNLRGRQEEAILSAADRKHLSQSGELLAEELVYALDIITRPPVSAPM